jgi:hypothetical protein
VTSVKEAAMKQKKKLLGLNQRFSEPEETVPGEAGREYPVLLVGRRSRGSRAPVDVVEHEAVVVLPRTFEWTVVPGPAETQ